MRVKDCCCCCCWCCRRCRRRRCRRRRRWYKQRLGPSKQATWAYFGICLVFFKSVVVVVVVVVAVVVVVGPPSGYVGPVLDQLGAILGAMLARLRAMLAHLVAMLAHLGAILGVCWPILGLCGPKLAGHVGPSGGYVGPACARFGAYVGPCWPILIHKIEKMAYVFTSLLWRGENATQQFHGRGAWAPGLTGLRPLSPTPRGCGHGEQEAGNTDMLILMLSVFFTRWRPSKHQNNDRWNYSLLERKVQLPRLEKGGFATLKQQGPEGWNGLPGNGRYCLTLLSEPTRN